MSRFQKADVKGKLVTKAIDTINQEALARVAEAVGTTPMEDVDKVRLEKRKRKRLRRNDEEEVKGEPVAGDESEH